MYNFSALNTLMKKIVEIGPMGCACMVSKHGEAVFEEYCGYADRGGCKGQLRRIRSTAVYLMTKVMTVTWQHLCCT